MLLFNKYDLFPLFNIEYYFKGQILEVTNFNMISQHDTNSTRFSQIWIEYKQVYVKFMSTYVTH